MEEVTTPWHPISELREGNATGTDSKNEGGMIIYCTNGVETIEFQAVGIERRNVTNSKYRRKTFKQQLRDQYEAAQEACDVINEQFAVAKGLREQAIAASNSNGNLQRVLDEASQAIEALQTLRMTLQRRKDEADKAANKAEDTVDDLRVRDTAEAV